MRLILTLVSQLLRRSDLGDDMKKCYLIVIIVSVILINTVTVSAQVEPPVVYEMDDKSTTTIFENGDARVEEVISLSAAGYAMFKQQYPMLSMLTRLFKSKRLDAEYEDLRVDVDDANNKITATYVIKGAAINKKDYWEIRVASEKEKVTLSAQIENTLVLTFTGLVTKEYRTIITSTIILPAEAKNITFNSETNTITYELPQKQEAGGFAIAGNPIFLIVAVAAVALMVVNFVLTRRKAPHLAPSTNR